MHKYLIFIFFLFCQLVDAQNLVTNGNFEQYSKCPDQKAQLDRAIGWHGIWGAGSGSCEYYNVCSSNWQLSPPRTWGGGFQYPRSGKGYIGYGFYAHNSNHVEEFSANDLYDKLTNEEIYKIQFFISAGNGINYAISDIGVHITDSINANSIYNGLIIPEVLNNKGFVYDTLNWFKIEGFYKAKGGERYIVIGCFNPNPADTILQSGLGEGVYYLIEDVAIFPINAPIAAAQCISDTFLCLGNSLSPGQTVVEDQYKAEYEWFWYELGKEKDTLSIEEFPVFQPDTTTTYVLKLTDFKYDVTYDTVTVQVVDCKKPTSLKVYPNPTNDKVYFEFNSTIPEGITIEIYNLMGQKIIGNQYRSNRELKALEINLQTQATGIYFYRVIMGNEVLFNGKIIKI